MQRQILLRSLVRRSWQYQQQQQQQRTWQTLTAVAASTFATTTLVSLCDESSKNNAIPVDDGGIQDVMNMSATPLIPPSVVETETPSLTKAKIKRVETTVTYRPGEKGIPTMPEQQESSQSTVTTKEEQNESCNHSVNVDGDDDDEDDEDTHCIFCLTFRHEPCRSVWRPFERCMKKRGPNQTADACDALLVPFTGCLSQYAPYYALIMNKMEQGLSAGKLQSYEESAVPMPNTMSTITWMPRTKYIHPDIGTTLNAFVQDSSAQQILSDTIASKEAGGLVADGAEMKEAIANIERLEGINTRLADTGGVDAEPNYHPVVVEFAAFLNTTDNESNQLVMVFAKDEHGVLVGKDDFGNNYEEKEQSSSNSTSSDTPVEENQGRTNNQLPYLAISVDVSKSRRIHVYAVYKKKGQASNTGEADSVEEPPVVYKSEPVVLLEAAIRGGMPMK